MPLRRRIFMKPETRFWKFLEERVSEMGHFSRVEPPPSPGIPDVNYCIKSIEGWIELKVRSEIRYPFKKRGLLRASQRRWYKRRIATRGRVLTCVLIGRTIHLISAQASLRVRRTTTLDEFRMMCSLIILKTDTNLVQELRSCLMSDTYESNS